MISLPKQFPRPHPERIRKPLDVDEAEVLFAALDAADVGAVELGGKGELFLGHFPGHRLAELPNARAEALLDLLLLRLVHAQLVGKLWTISLWTMNHIWRSKWRYRATVKPKPAKSEAPP